MSTGRGGLQGIQPISSLKYGNGRDTVQAPHGRELNPSNQSADKLNFSRVGRGGNGNFRRYFSQPGLFEGVTRHELAQARGSLDGLGDQKAVVDKTGRGGWGNIRRAGRFAAGTGRSSGSSDRPSSPALSLAGHRSSSSFLTLDEPNTSTASLHKRSNSVVTLEEDRQNRDVCGSPRATKDARSLIRHRNLFKRLLKREPSLKESHLGDWRSTSSLNLDEEYPVISLMSRSSPILRSPDPATPNDRPSIELESEQGEEQPTVPTTSPGPQKKRRPRPVGMILKETEPMSPELQVVFAVNLLARTPTLMSPSSFQPHPLPIMDDGLQMCPGPAAQTEAISPMSPPQIKVDLAIYPQPHSFMEFPHSSPAPLSTVTSHGTAWWEEIGPPLSSGYDYCSTLGAKASSVFLPLSPSSPQPTSPIFYVSDSPSRPHSMSAPLKRSRSLPCTKGPPMYPPTPSPALPEWVNQAMPQTASPYSGSYEQSLTPFTWPGDPLSPQSALSTVDAYLEPPPSPVETLPKYESVVSPLIPTWFDSPPNESNHLHLSIHDDWLSSPFRCSFSRCTIANNGGESNDGGEL